MVKTQAQQSIWPVSVFGLGFNAADHGLLGGGQAIQETRRIHQQILSVEDSYRHIENLVEGIRADTIRCGHFCGGTRLLDSSGVGEDYARQLKGLRAKTGGDLEKLRGMRPQQESKVLDRLGNRVTGLMGRGRRRISGKPAEEQDGLGPGSVRIPEQEDIRRN